MSEYTINEASKVTRIPRSAIQKAVVSGVLAARVETLPSLRTRYLIEKAALDSFSEEFSLTGNLDSSYKSHGKVKQKSSDKDVLSAKIRRRIEILHEAREIGIPISELY